MRRVFGLLKLFNLQIPISQIESDLSRYLKKDVKIEGIQVDIARETSGSRLAIATISTPKKYVFLVKESTEHELNVLHIVNKVVGKFVPRVLRWDKGESVFIWLENVPGWLNPFLFKVAETLIDIIFEYHSYTIFNYKEVGETFLLQLPDKGYITSVCDKALEALYRDQIIEKSDLDCIKKRLGDTLNAFKQATFPLVLAHGYFVPSVIRAEGDRVVFYDWNCSSLTYPQIDLVLLMDRLITISNYQRYPCDIDFLLHRYLRELNDLGVKGDFYPIYNTCYFFKILPLLRHWSLCKPVDERVEAEVKSKIATMKRLEVI
jgi:hypothetical protein